MSILFNRQKCLYCGGYFHLFMIRPLYHELRNTHFKPIWKMHISEQRFYSIMKSSDVESILSIAKFLVGAFDLRKLKIIQNDVTLCAY